MSFSRVLSVKNVGLCALLLSSSFVQAATTVVKGSIFEDVEAACLIEHMAKEAGGVLTSENVKARTENILQFVQAEKNADVDTALAALRGMALGSYPDHHIIFEEANSISQQAKAKGVTLSPWRIQHINNSLVISQQDKTDFADHLGNPNFKGTWAGFGTGKAGNGGHACLTADKDLFARKIGVPKVKLKRLQKEWCDSKNVMGPIQDHLDALDESAGNNHVTEALQKTDQLRQKLQKVPGGAVGGGGDETPHADVYPWQAEIVYDDLVAKHDAAKAEIDTYLNDKTTDDAEIADISAALANANAFGTEIAKGHNLRSWMGKALYKKMWTDQKANAQVGLFGQVEHMDDADAVNALKTPVTLAAAIDEKDVLKRWMVAGIDRKEAWVGDAGKKAREHAGKAFSTYLKKGATKINKAQNLANLTTEFNNGKAENEKLAEWQIEMLVKCYPGKDKMKVDNCQDIYNVVKAVYDALHNGNQALIGTTGQYVPAMVQKAHPRFTDVKTEIGHGINNTPGAATGGAKQYITGAQLPTVLPAGKTLNDAFKDKRIALAYFMIKHNLTY